MTQEPIDKYRKQLGLQDKAADTITAFSGSMLFVYIHSILFFVWIVLNVSATESWIPFLPHNFDPFPFGLLTMAVSLEAIFLATFVLISQNRQAEKADLRAELDYKVNVKAEREVEEIQTKLNEILTQINKK